jgi:hypothetical protein
MTSTKNTAGNSVWPKSGFSAGRQFSASKSASSPSAKTSGCEKPNFKIYLQKNNPKISLEFTSACLPESVFQTGIFL